MRLTARLRAALAARRIFWLVLLFAMFWVGMIAMTRRTLNVPDGAVAQVSGKSLFHEGQRAISGPANVVVHSASSIWVSKAADPHQPIDVRVGVSLKARRLVVLKTPYRGEVSASISLPEGGVFTSDLVKSIRKDISAAFLASPRLYEIPQAEQQDFVDNRLRDVFSKHQLKVSSVLISFGEDSSVIDEGVNVELPDGLVLEPSLSGPKLEAFIPPNPWGAIVGAVLLLSFLGAGGLVPWLWVWFAPLLLVAPLSVERLRRTASERAKEAGNMAADAAAETTDICCSVCEVGGDGWLFSVLPDLSPQDSIVEGTADVVSSACGDPCAVGPSGDCGSSIPDTSGCHCGDCGSCDAGGCDCGGCDCGGCDFGGCDCAC